MRHATPATVCMTASPILLAMASQEGLSHETVTRPILKIFRSRGDPSHGCAALADAIVSGVG